MRLTRNARARWLAAVLAVVVVGGGVGAIWASRAGQPHRPTGELVLATGGTQGVYYTYGRALARELTASAPGLHVRVLSTTGSVENLKLVGADRNTCAFTADDAAAAAVSARDQFPNRIPLAAVGRIYDDYMHLVVAADSDITSLPDLRNRKVSVGSRGSGTALIADRILAESGLSRAQLHVAELGIDESVDAFRRGAIDAFFWSGGVPTDGIGQAARERPLRLVALPDAAQRLTTRYGAIYHPAAIPAGSYGLATPTQTVAIPNFLVCRPDARADVVQLLLDTVFGARGQIEREVPAVAGLDRRAAIETAPVPLHAAARDWFRRTKG